MISITSQNSLIAGEKHYRCVLGRSGVLKNKREGDGATPAGLFQMLRVFYRPDRVAPLKTDLPALKLTPNDGWCDDPSHADYNRHINVPHNASHEVLWRKDHIYDMIVVLEYNMSPIVPFRGSAIFLHCATPSYELTDGCVALKDTDLVEILKTCSNQTRVRITTF